MCNNYYAQPSPENEITELPADQSNHKGYYGYALPTKNTKTKVKYNLTNLLQEAKSQPHVQEISSKHSETEKPIPKTGKEEMQDIPKPQNSQIQNLKDKTFPETYHPNYNQVSFLQKKKKI